MAQNDYSGRVGRNTNICFNCQKACGGCSWTVLDPATKKPRFEPIAGWTARKVLLNLGRHNGKDNVIETYHITACPEFVPDEPRASNNCEMSDKDWIRMIRKLGRFRRVKGQVIIDD